MTDQPQRRSRSGLGLGGLVAVAVGVAVAIYVGLSAQGNRASAACAGAAEKAARLEALSVGDVAAFRPAETPVSLSDLAFHKPDGTATTLADFAGRTLLVNLWATWCVPCRAEMPALDRLSASAGSADFAVVPVSLDSGSADKPRQFLEEIEAKALPLYVDPDLRLMDDMKRLGLGRGLPTTLLVDEAGCQLGVMEGPAEWDSADARALIAAALAD